MKQALTEINRLELWSSEIPLATEELVSVLSIAKMAMDEISKDDANLLTAEGAFEFLFLELERLDCTLSSELLDQVKVQLTKRRQKPLVSLLKFLQDPTSIDEDKTSFFAPSSKKEIIAYASQIWSKYFHFQVDVEEVSQSQIPVRTTEDEELSIQDRLGMSIGRRTTLASPEEATNTSSIDRSTIKLACENYIKTNQMHPCLKQMFDALILVKPTSIKNEQNFSMSSSLLSKTRKQMVIGTLNDLCLLKSHYCSLKK